MPDPTAKPVNFCDRQQLRARRLAFRSLIVRLLFRFSKFGPPPPGNCLRHVCGRLRAVLDAAAPLPDEAAFFAFSCALERLLDIANVHALVRDDLTPSRQAALFRRAAEHHVKARVILAVTGEPPEGAVREENTTVLDAAIEAILGEDIDADQIRRDLFVKSALLEQVLKQAAELATTPPWSMRGRPTWPLGLMQELVHIWTVILGRRAGASEDGPFSRFATAVLELLGFPKNMRSGAAILAEYRRHRVAK